MFLGLLPTHGWLGALIMLLLFQMALRTWLQTFWMCTLNVNWLFLWIYSLPYIIPIFYAFFISRLKVKNSTVICIGAHCKLKSGLLLSLLLLFHHHVQLAQSNICVNVAHTSRETALNVWPTLMTETKRMVWVHHHMHYGANKSATQVITVYSFFPIETYALFFPFLYFILLSLFELIIRLKLRNFCMPIFFFKTQNHHHFVVAQVQI